MLGVLSLEPNLRDSTAHNQEPISRTTTPYSCHVVFTDRSIFSLNLPRILTPEGTSVTNHKHGHGVFTDRSIFSLNLPRIQTPAETSVTNQKHGHNF